MAIHDLAAWASNAYGIAMRLRWNWCPRASGNRTPVYFALTSGCFLLLRKFTPIECTALKSLGGGLKRVGRLQVLVESGALVSRSNP